MLILHSTSGAKSMNRLRIVLLLGVLALIVALVPAAAAQE